MKRLVSDTGPLLHLHKAGAHHLHPLIGETIIPPVVLDEIRIHAPEFYRAQEWLKLPTVPETVCQRAKAWVEGGVLHRGEAEALAVALEVQPDWFLTDDAAARVMGESLGNAVRNISCCICNMKSVKLAQGFNPHSAAALNFPKEFLRRENRDFAGRVIGLVARDDGADSAFGFGGEMLNRIFEIFET
jgi:uncharacterized protein